MSTNKLPDQFITDMLEAMDTLMEYKIDVVLYGPSTDSPLWDAYIDQRANLYKTHGDATGSIPGSKS